MPSNQNEGRRKPKFEIGTRVKITKGAQRGKGEVDDIRWDEESGTYQYSLEWDEYAHGTSVTVWLPESYLKAE